MNPPGPIRVAVVTPYFREAPEVLEQCHQSVRGQTYPCTHFMIADGAPRPEVAGWTAEQIILPRPHHDNGNTPRAIGSLSAMNQGYDAIAYLDADNWYFPPHIASMVDLHRETGAAVCTATRTIHRLDGMFLYADTRECDGKEHVDTSCLFLTRAAFRLLPLWAMMPRELGPICDTVMWHAIVARRLPRAHEARPTVAFRTRYEVHYRNAGEPAPPGAVSTASSTGKAIDWWNALAEPVREDWMRYFGIPWDPVTSRPPGGW